MAADMLRYPVGMTRVSVNPEVLRWARVTAGLDLETAAKKLQIGPAKGVLPEDRLRALEEGEELPTRPLLVRMSNQYRRPLVTLYLGQPPTKGDRGEDFRRLPEGYTDADDALVDALLRDIRARQSIVRAYIEDEDDAAELPFIGSAALTDGPDHVAELIRQTTGFELETFRSKRTALEAFSYLRERAEHIGVFVLLAGDLGSHHTSIGVEAFRGFALADPIAPFIVINDKDARAAWSFTLLHELAHLWLGQTGVSGALHDSQVERFCNDVAGRILLIPNELQFFDLQAGVDLPELADTISEFADARNISRAMVAYSLYRANRISFETWDDLRREFRRQWIAVRDERRERARQTGGGPNPNTVKKHRVGPALLDFVSRELRSGTMTSTKAGKVLGVKPQRVYTLVDQAR